MTSPISTFSATSTSISHITYPTPDVSSSASNDNKNIVNGESHETEKRLWLGNLDPKLTEFYLLKLVQKYGSIDHFDFLFHRSGPNLGLPRGYAFVEYEDRKSAEDCMAGLDGRKILERHMAVRWAHQAVKEYPDEQTKLKARLPALSVQESEGPGPSMSKEKAILAIEAKLMAMEREKGQQSFNLTLNKPTSSKGLIGSRSGGLSKSSSAYKQPAPTQQRQHYNKPYDRNRKPYTRN